MKSFGLVSFIFFAAAIVFMVRRWPADSSKTFSQNAARAPSSVLYYGTIMLIFLGLLSVFTYGWFIPSLQLPTVYAAVFAIGVAGQTVAALVPETAGWRVPVHRYSTGVMYFSTIPLVGILAFSVRGPATIRVLLALAFLLLALLIAVTLAFKRLQEHAMALQITHLTIVAAALMLATYAV